MKLHLKTSLSPHKSSYKFTLQAKIDVTTEEESLVNYIGTNKVLATTEKDVGIIIPDVRVSNIKVGDLLVGLTLTFDDIDDLIQAKNQIRNAAKNLVLYIRHLKLLWKVETVDMPTDES